MISICSNKKEESAIQTIVRRITRTPVARQVELLCTTGEVIKLCPNAATANIMSATKIGRENMISTNQ